MHLVSSILTHPREDVGGRFSTLGFVVRPAPKRCNNCAGFIGPLFAIVLDLLLPTYLPPRLSSLDVFLIACMKTSDVIIILAAGGEKKNIDEYGESPGGLGFLVNNF